MLDKNIFIYLFVLFIDILFFDVSNPKLFAPSVKKYSKYFTRVIYEEKFELILVLFLYRLLSLIPVTPSFLSNLWTHTIFKLILHRKDFDLDKEKLLMTMVAYFSTCYFFYFFTDSSLYRGIFSPCLLFCKKSFSKVEHSAVILEQSLGARNRVGTELSCLWPTRARICKRLWSLGIDSEKSIPPAYVAWRAGTTNRVVAPSRQAENRFLGS